MNGTGPDDAVMIEEHERVVLEDTDGEVIASDESLETDDDTSALTDHTHLNQWLQEYYAIEAEIAPQIERQRELVRLIGGFLSTLPGRKVQLADGGQIKVMKSGDVRIYPPSEVL